MSDVAARLPAGLADAHNLTRFAPWKALPSRIATFSLIELQKLKHDKTEVLTRVIQPILWLVIFGTTFSRIKAIPTGDVPYLDYLAPGIIAQSAMFIAIFYGIHIVWERDAGVLAKLLVTPTPRSALVTAKAFAAGIRALTQVVAVVILTAIMGVSLMLGPLRLLGTIVVVMLGTAFFACLSMTIAGLVRNRDRMMGIGQVLTMPLFFASNALYPLSVMPDWLKVVSYVNPLSYEVSALRSLLIGTPTNLPLDLAILALSTLLGIVVASSVLGRLTR